MPDKIPIPWLFSLVFSAGALFAGLGRVVIIQKSQSADIKKNTENIADRMSSKKCDRLSSKCQEENARRFDKVDVKLDAITMFMGQVNEHMAAQNERRRHLG